RATASSRWRSRLRARRATGAALPRTRSGEVALGYGALSVRLSQHRPVKVCCVTGATGFVGGHVAKLLAERGDRTRVTYRDRRRLERLRALDLEPVRTDVLDRAALRRAFRGCDVVFHTAGFVGSRPPERVWQLNALAPRLAVEAAGA